MGKKFKVLMPTRQQALPGVENPEGEGSEDGLGWKFKMELSINDKVGGRDKLTVIAGEVPADRVEELVVGSVRSKRFLGKLRAIVGEPLFPTKGEDDSDDDKRF